MPQLVKGGKHAFGWSRVGRTGRIVVPQEALDEYCLGEGEKLIAVPGSQRSGGFGLGAQESLGRSPLGRVLGVCTELADSSVPEGDLVVCEGKPYCWVQLRSGGIAISLKTLERYGIRSGDRLLVIRGSGLAIGFAVRGPIVAEASTHPELLSLEPELEEE